MAELADAADSKSAEGNLVGVRPPLPAPINQSFTTEQLQQLLSTVPKLCLRKRQANSEDDADQCTASRGQKLWTAFKWPAGRKQMLNQNADP
jgi:hypothetical protein